MSLTSLIRSVVDYKNWASCSRMYNQIEIQIDIPSCTLTVDQFASSPWSWEQGIGINLKFWVITCSNTWLVRTKRANSCQSLARATSEVTRDFIAGDSYNSFLLITHNINSVQITIFGQRHTFAQFPILVHLSIWSFGLNGFDDLEWLIEINLTHFSAHHDC